MNRLGSTPFDGSDVKRSWVSITSSTPSKTALHTAAMMFSDAMLALNRVGKPTWMEGVALQLRRMLDANANVMVFLADWHAWVNDKFNGDMEAIQTTGVYMQETFRALLNHPPEGTGPGELQFMWASELMESSDYWARVLRCSKGATLAMVERHSPSWDGTKLFDHDLSKFYYPAMQAADIFEMDIDIAIGGMDQRKAHMLCETWPQNMVGKRRRASTPRSSPRSKHLEPEWSPLTTKCQNPTLMALFCSTTHLNRFARR